MNFHCLTKMVTLVAAIGLLVGCEGDPNRNPVVSPTITDKLVYLKDKHGICYAVLNSYTQGSYYVGSITTVPCDKVGL